MGEDYIFDDIFEVIRAIYPDHKFLCLKDNPEEIAIPPKPLVFRPPNNESEYYVCPSRTYMDSLREPLNPHSISSFSPEKILESIANDIPSVFYRGETDANRPLSASIFRVDYAQKESPEIQRLISELRIIEFTMLLKKMPVVMDCEASGLNVNYRGLAQHYGLKTNFIDFTSEIFIAAFFATQHYNPDTNTYESVCESDGESQKIGKIIYMWDPMFFSLPESMTIYGLQPFKRPTYQYAYGKEHNLNSPFSFKIYKFKQNKEMNDKIHDLFIKDGRNILFPNEPIGDVADKLKEIRVLSTEAIDIYYNNMDMRGKTHTSKKYLYSTLKNNGYEISHKSISDILLEKYDLDVSKFEYSGWWDGIDVSTREVWYSND